MEQNRKLGIEVAEEMSHLFSEIERFRRREITYQQKLMLVRAVQGELAAGITNGLDYFLANLGDIFLGSETWGAVSEVLGFHLAKDVDLFKGLIVEAIISTLNRLNFSNLINNDKNELWLEAGSTTTIALFSITSYETL